MNKLFHSLQAWEKMQPIDFIVIDNLEKDFSMGRLFKLEKNVKRSEIKFQEGVLISFSRLSSLWFP